MVAGGSDGSPSSRAGAPTPDQVLAERVRAGDTAAFEELARRYLRPIHAVAASFLREQADVEDAAQETFLRALRAISTYDPARPFAPWLYQIARNVARDRLGQRRRWRAGPAQESLVDPAPDPDSALERREARRLVDAALERLPEQRRTAFRLFDIEGYSAAEVARLMGLTEGTVRSHVHHARRALRAALAPLLGREAEP